MKKTLKILSTITLILWSITLTLSLSFGVGVANKLIKTFSNFYNEKINKFEIIDVEVVNLEDIYITNKTFNLEYKVKSTKEKDYQLTFESLDTDVFTVTSIGAIKGNVFDEKERTGRLEIKSKVDKAFSKVIEIKFYNTFPEEFDASILNINRTKDIYVNIPFYVYPSIINALDYTNKKITLEFDEEYIQQIGQYKFMPIKATDSTIIKVKIGDKAVEKEIAIKDEEVLIPDSFEILTYGNIPYQVGKGSYFKFYNGDKLVPCNIKIEKETEQKILVSQYDTIGFNSDGEKVINVDILDKDGNVIKTLTQTIYVLPKEEIVDLSLVPEKITLYQYETKRVIMELAHNAQVIENEKTLNVSYNYSEKVLNIYDSVPGEKTITLNMTIYDGEKVYDETKQIKIIVLEDKTSKSYVNAQTAKFVSKIMGHMGLFVLEGLLAIWFIIFHHHKKHKIYDILVYISIGLSVGLLTEFIQVFLDGRSPTLKDVGIDFSGYLIGGIIAVGIYFLTRVIKSKVHKKHESK